MRFSLTSIVRPAMFCGAFIVAIPATGQSQGQPAATPAPASAGPVLSRAELTAYAKVQLAIAKVGDSTQRLLGLPENNNDKMGAQIRAQLKETVARILSQGGMTDEEYRHKTYIVSSDGATRWAFDSVVAQLTGAPMPIKVTLPAGMAGMTMPAGPVGTHLGHVMTGFGGTPDGGGLLPTAMADARVAIQHAGLAARTPTNLDAMKMHAGHVINAVDPTIVATGPGSGYGVKKAALGVATHVDLAAKAQGASQNVMAHAVHVAMAAHNTAQRCDDVVALAQKIQAATTAEAAAPLVAQLVTMTQQLIGGVDANADGKITWEAGEGGLQTAQDHMLLLLNGEHSPQAPH